eukprot:966566-Karenia_brevis.AAC.1
MAGAVAAMLQILHVRKVSIHVIQVVTIVHPGGEDVHPGNPSGEDVHLGNPAGEDVHPGNPSGGDVHP